MKKLMIMMILVGPVFTTQAQAGKNKGGPELEDEKERMEKAKTHLELTDDQFEQWKAIHKKYGDEMKAMRDERTEEQKKGQALREKIDSELATILTHEQKKKFAEVKKNGPKGRRPKGKKPDGRG